MFSEVRLYHLCPEYLKAYDIIRAGITHCPGTPMYIHMHILKKEKTSTLHHKQSLNENVSKA